MEYRPILTWQARKTLTAPKSVVVQCFARLATHIFYRIYYVFRWVTLPFWPYMGTTLICWIKIAISNIAKSLTIFKVLANRNPPSCLFFSHPPAPIPLLEFSPLFDLVSLHKKATHQHKLFLGLAVYRHKSVLSLWCSLLNHFMIFSHTNNNVLFKDCSISVSPIFILRCEGNWWSRWLFKFLAVHPLIFKVREVDAIVVHKKCTAS